MEGDSFVRYSVEVSNIRYVATHDEVTRVMRSLLAGSFCSLSYTARSGKAVVEVSSRAAAEAAVRAISACHELAFAPSGQRRTLRAQLMSTANSATHFTQTEEVQRWTYLDGSALDKSQQDSNNNTDLETLFDRLTHSNMRGCIRDAVLEKQAGEGLVLKELYLALSRPCELVFAGSRGQKDTLVLRSSEVVLQEHIDAFAPLFRELPKEARRTGIDATLHRISRSVHAIVKEPNAITARVGRTIQGTVLPMLIDSAAVDPIEALAQLASKGLLLIGQPNVGKTTVLRELARLLSAGSSRVVVIVDKSMEVAGTSVVPHLAIGNARVLTVERPEEQDRVMIEAVENQSPDIVIVDELTNREQCNAARTITGRGVAVIATVHGDGLASLMNDHDRSLLIGGVASVTLSAREAEARADKLRQVNKRMGSAVFGVGVELRGYRDWVVHEDLEHAIDKYLDHAPFPASWRTVRDAGGAHGTPSLVEATPMVGCRQQGSSIGFGYACLRLGESLASGIDGVNFHATDPTSGQRIWTELGNGSRIYERTRPASAGSGPSFSFGGLNGGVPNGHGMGHGNGAAPNGLTNTPASGGGTAFQRGANMEAWSTD